MQTKFLAVSISMVALLSAGCDPEAPVQSSDVSQEIDSSVAVHAADPTTHTNLLLPAGNVSGEFDSTQLADNSVGNSELATSSVGSDEIADTSIAQADMGAGSVGTTQIVDLSITSLKLAANSVSATQMANNAIVGGFAGTIMDGTINVDDIGPDAVTSAEILNNSVATGDILDNTIDDADLADNAIDATSLATDSVDTAEIAANAVQAAEIDADAVITAKIMDANVTTAKLADASIVLGAKVNLGTVGQVLDPTTAAFSSVFTFAEEDDAVDRTVRIIGACESDVMGSQLRLRDDNQTNVVAVCPDTNLNGPAQLFDLTVLANDANGDLVEIQVDAGANNGLVRWRVYSITISP